MTFSILKISVNFFYVCWIIYILHVHFYMSRSPNYTCHMFSTISNNMDLEWYMILALILHVYMYIKIYAIAQYIWYTPLWIYPLTVKHISLSAKLKRTNLGISLGFGYRCCSSNLVLCYISPLHLGLGKFLLTFYSVVWNIDLIF